MYIEEFVDYEVTLSAVNLREQTDELCFRTRRTTSRKISITRLDTVGLT